MSWRVILSPPPRQYRMVGRIVAWWEDHFEVLEGLSAVFLAAAVAAWIYCGNGWAFIAPLLHDKRAAIYGTLAALLGSLLGFVIAAVAIVIGEADRLGFIRQAGQLPALFNVFRMSISALGIGTIIALVALVADGEPSPQRWVPPLVLFGCTLSFFRVRRAIWILKAVMRRAAGPNETESG